MEYRIFDKECNEYVEDPDYRWMLSRNGKLYNSENDEWHELGERYLLERSLNFEDKNNINVFEGDVVESYFDGKFEYNAIIEEDTCNPCFVLKPINYKYEWHIEYDFIACNLRVIEVTGTIHDK